MTPDQAAVKGLGAYMKAIARHLRDGLPLSPEEAAGYAYVDVPYATMVLLRLELREIAARFDQYIDNGFVRGKRWHDAALAYKWMPDISVEDLDP